MDAVGLEGGGGGKDGIGRADPTIECTSPAPPPPPPGTATGGKGMGGAADACLGADRETPGSDRDDGATPAAKAAAG